MNDMSKMMPSDLRNQIASHIELYTNRKDLDNDDAMNVISIAYPLIRKYLAEDHEPNPLNNKVCGLELSLIEGEKITTPLCALVVVKQLNEEGQVQFLARATEGITSVEALGMSRYATLRLEEALRSD